MGRSFQGRSSDAGEDCAQYQVRWDRSLYRHWIVVLSAYSFIVWHQLTGGLRRRDRHQPLETFTNGLEAMRTAISYRFVLWRKANMDVFTAYKASFDLLGLKFI